MKCLECVASGQKSTVQSNGGTKTLLGWRGPFYDENGDLHSHDPNIVTSWYSCSNGHEFTKQGKAPCPNQDCHYGKPWAHSWCLAESRKLHGVEPPTTLKVWQCDSCDETKQTEEPR